MKTINLLKHLRRGINLNNSLLARSKNDWDPVKLYPYNPVDEHVEPKEEDIIREMFDRDYYHFGNKAMTADAHPEKDMFTHYRQWQHLYTHPNEPFLGWTQGSVIVKYLYLALPVLVFIFYLKIFPNHTRQILGRNGIRKYNTKF